MTQMTSLKFNAEDDAQPCELQKVRVPKSCSWRLPLGGGETEGCGGRRGRAVGQGNRGMGGSGGTAKEEEREAVHSRGGAAEALTWEQVTFRAASGRWILGNVSGSAAAGRLLAVMGPSGCGKTTLLKVLARRLPRQRGARLGGRVTQFATPVAYVPQEPRFFSHLTTRETLTLACALAGDPAPGESADAALKRAGLAECAAGRVGGDTTGHAVAGVSGGERRRLSIACETVAYGLAPVIADEPTSGLDSFHADRVVRLLKGMAEEGRIVVASLHAPRSASFDMVDDVLLMSEGGRVCYAGPRAGCVAHFASLGHACPEHYNEAEFLIDLVSVDTSTGERQRESLARVRRLQVAWERREGMNARAPGGSGGSGGGSSGSGVRAKHRLRCEAQGGSSCAGQEGPLALASRFANPAGGHAVCRRICLNHQVAHTPVLSVQRAPLGRVLYGGAHGSRVHRDWDARWANLLEITHWEVSLLVRVGAQCYPTRLLDLEQGANLTGPERHSTPLRGHVVVDNTDLHPRVGQGRRCVVDRRNRREEERGGGGERRRRRRRRSGGGRERAQTVEPLVGGRPVARGIPATAAGDA